MPAATNKSDLISVSTKEFEKLQALLDRVPNAMRLEPDDGDTSLKDIVGHRAHWIDLFLGWYSDGQAGKRVFFPAKGFKWNELNRYNANLRANQADLTWEDARKMLEQNHHSLMNWMARNDDRALYGNPMKGANNNWTPGRWAEAAGPSHYRSAAKYIRARLKAAEPASI